MKEKDEIIVKITDFAGSFAENKDIARELREKQIFPNLKKNKTILLDYSKVSGTTQSFTHALISEAIRTLGISVLDRISFKNCNDEVKKVISIVVEYMKRNIDKPIS